MFEVGSAAEKRLVLRTQASEQGHIGPGERRERGELELALQEAGDADRQADRVAARRVLEIGEDDDREPLLGKAREADAAVPGVQRRRLAQQVVETDAESVAAPLEDLAG